MVNENPWLVKYLTDGAEEENPNDDILIALPVDDEESSIDDTVTDTEDTSRIRLRIIRATGRGKINRRY